LNTSTGIAAILMCFAGATSAFAGEYRFKLMASPKSSEEIADLEWSESKDTQEPVLQSRTDGEKGPKQYATPPGRLFK